MNFWKFFKGETTEELIARSTAAVKERYNRGMRARTSYMEMYNTEMRNLESLEDDIVSPPKFTIKKDKYRNKRLRVLNSVITECKKCYSNDIDDKLHEAEIFHSYMTDARRYILNEISEHGRERALMLQNGLPVGSIENPGAFHLTNSIIAKEHNRSNERNLLDFLEYDIQKDVKDSMIDFKPESVWKIDQQGRLGEEYVTLEGYNDDLRNILRIGYDFGYEYKPKFKNLVVELHLEDDESSSISGILRKKDLGEIGASGFDFMAERHPNILAYVIFHKLLTKMQNNFLAILGHADEGVNFQSLLNPKGYIDLFAQEQALSRIVSELPSLQQNMLQEYEQFRNVKINNHKTNESVSEISHRIMQGFLDGKKIDEIYENEMNVMMEIRNKIIEPDENVEDKDGFRKMQMQILEGMIQKYKECFGDHVDDRICNTEIFLTEMKKDGFLENLNEKGMELDEYLYNQNKNRVGSKNNPGVFYYYKEVDSYIKNLNENNDKLTVKKFKSNIDKSVACEMMAFLPGFVLDDKVELEHWEKCNSYLTNWGTLSILENSCNFWCDEDKDKVREVVRSLNLDEDLKRIFPGIFDQESKAQGMTGLDFMIENIPSFLFNMLRYRMLNNYDESVLKLLREKEDISLLNLPKYMEFYAKKKTLERAVSQYPLLNSELKQQYEEFRDKPIAKSAKKMNKRMWKAVRRGADIEWIYNEEMKRLVDSQRTIVKSAKYNKNLDEDIRILKGKIANCRKFFAENMDDRLHEAEIFVQNLTAGDKTARNEFLEQVNVRGLDAVLHEKNEEWVGSEKNPGISQFQNIINERFKGKNEQQKIPIEFMEGDVHEDVKESINKFEPQAIKDEVDYNKLRKYYNFLKSIIINNNYELSNKIGLLKLAEEFKIDENISSPIRAILQKKGAAGCSGLEFMVECHPQILADVILYEVLKNMDKAYLEHVKDEGQLHLLKSDEYLNLYARKKALSSFIDRLAQSMGDLKSGYLKFNLKFRLFKKFKVDDTYKEFSKFWDGKKENEDFAEGFDDAFNAACRVHFELISRYLKGKIFLTKEERILLDSHMGEIIKAMRYVRVDSNQSNTCTTKFFNAIGWSSNKVNTSDDIGEKKMFYTISPSREIKAQEMVKQLIGKGDYLGQHYSKRNDIGEGIYAWAANPDMKVDGAEETSSNTSWSDGRQKGSVQFTVALNKRAKVIDNEQVGEKMSDFKEKFPNTYASSKSYGKDERKFQSIFLAFMGYNVNRMKAADESGGIDCYCITDPKVITMDPTIAVRVGAGRKNNTQRPTIVSQKLEEYLA